MIFVRLFLLFLNKKNKLNILQLRYLTPNVEIISGKHALTGAGAVVAKDVEPYSIMVGNPAQKIGTIDEYGNRQLFNKNK